MVYIPDFRVIINITDPIGGTRNNHWTMGNSPPTQLQLTAARSELLSMSGKWAELCARFFLAQTNPSWTWKWGAKQGVNPLFLEDHPHLVSELVIIKPPIYDHQFGQCRTFGKWSIQTSRSLREQQRLTIVVATTESKSWDDLQRVKLTSSRIRSEQR